MSPIYVRPEREQAEHDRLIRFLQAKYSRKFEVVANPGDERVAPVKVATNTHFPDLVLNEDKRLAGVVEIETAASVNNLETMAKWVPFSRARVPFHLYVPVQGYEATMRLAEAHRVKAAEIWTYRPASDGFDLVRMFVDADASRPARSAASKPASSKSKAAAPKPPAARTPSPKVARGAKTAKPAADVRPARPARSAAPAKATKAARPAPARKAAARRPKPAARAKPAKPAPKGGKKGTGARKTR